MSIKTFEAKAYGSAEEWAARTGTFVEEHEIDHIIDYDCDAYDAEGKPLFMFRKNVIPSSLCRSAYGALRSAATPTDNRGDAAGEFYVSDDKVLSVRQGVIDGDKKQKGHQLHHRVPISSSSRLSSGSSFLLSGMKSRQTLRIISVRPCSNRITHINRMVVFSR